MSRFKRKKKRSLWIDIAFSCVILSLSAFAIWLLYIPDSPASESANKHTTNEKTSGSLPVTIDAIDSNYPGIKIVTEMSNDKRTPYAIQYPESMYDSFNEEVKSYINNERDQFKKKMEKILQAQDDAKGELNISFETLPHHSGHYSFVLVASSHFGGKQKSKTTIQSFHLNPETGDQHTIATIFDHNSKHLDKLSSIVREEILKDESLQDALYADKLNIFTAASWKNFKNYAITDQDLIFYFPENTIASASVGPLVISVPLKRINTLVLPIYQLKPDKDRDTPSEKNGNNTLTDPTNEEQLPTTEANQKKEAGSYAQAKNDPANTQTPATTKKKVALTFDDGPEPNVTPRILKTLAKYDAKATFFMLGSRVEYYPEIARQVQEAGHELGNHTWNHPDLTKLTKDKVTKEIHQTSDIIRQTTGQSPTAFRPPYGATNDIVKAISDSPIVLWDVDTLDWKHRNVKQLLQKVQEQTRDGSTILMHDIHQATADGLEQVLLYLKEEGYEFVTVSELNDQ